MSDTTSNIPDYQSIMLPLLELAGDGNTYRLRDAVDLLAQRFSLSNEELKEMLPSGYAPLFANRVGWASTYLKKARLLVSKKRVDIDYFKGCVPLFVWFLDKVP